MNGLRGSHVLRLLVLVGMSAWVTSCAHAHLERFVDGEKICEIESWVLGAGETEQVTTACGDYAYSTRDTGLSDNGTDALGSLAEGAAKGLLPTP